MWDKGYRPMEVDDSMEAERYVYTLGEAGTSFVNGLKQGKVLGRKCPNCKRVYVPPRMYCERCFSQLGEYVELRDPYIESCTIVYRDNSGRKLERPEVMGTLVFRAVEGRLTAYVEGTTDPLPPGTKVRITSYSIPLKVSL